jgi:hypothetical protein
LKIALYKFVTFVALATIVSERIAKKKAAEQVKAFAAKEREKVRRDTCTVTCLAYIDTS